LFEISCWVSIPSLSLLLSRVKGISGPVRQLFRFFVIGCSGLLLLISFFAVSAALGFDSGSCGIGCSGL
jgi:hypothetical protein